MSRSVVGDELCDVQALEMCDLINNTVTAKFCRNISITVAKKLVKSLGVAGIEIQDYLITRLQQSIGGHIGASKKRKN